MTDPPAARVWPRVATVVVTYNNLADTDKCIQALLAIDYPDHLIIVVDNGSTPPEAPMLAEKYPGTVEILRIEINHGYGPGANEGIRRGLLKEAEFVWLMNNDAVPERDSLRELVAAGLDAPKVGLMSPLVLAPIGPDAPNGIWYSGGEIDLRLVQARHLRDQPANNEPYATHYVTGCAMVARTALFRDIGLLREDFYLYWEDADLNLRAVRAGWDLLVVPTARVFHNGHGSIPSRTRQRYFYRNALFVLASCGSASTFFVGTFRLGLAVARAWGSAVLRRRERPVPETAGFATGLLGAVGARGRARRRTDPPA